jgi:hypothetical protein
MLMTEHYFVMPEPSFEGKYESLWGHAFKTYEDAELHAKKLASKKTENYLIMKSYATAKAVVPQIEVVKH